MEMSWFALAPTIVIALVLAVAVMLRSGEPTSVDAPKAAVAAAPSDPLSTLVGWLRNARRPVWPIDYREFNARVRRGFKLAGLMAAVVAIGVAAQPQQSSFGGLLFLLVGLLLMGAIFIAFACIASVIHSVILQILPYRGAIVSTVLGGGIGFAVAYFTRANGDPLNRTLIWSGATYGVVMSIINFSVVPERGRKSGTRRTA
jgi:hypothetical protein